MVYIILLAILVTLITLAVKPSAERWLLPYPMIIVILGFIVSEVIVTLGYDTGIRHNNFYFISSHFFIPLLIFNTALSFIKVQQKGQFISSLKVTLLVFVLTCLIAAALLYLIMSHPTGFPWTAAFITASLLAGTQTQAIVVLFKNLQVPQRILLFLENEGLFSELLAIICFSLLLSFALHTQEGGIIKHTWFVVWLLGGGILCGWLLGFPFRWLYRQSHSADYQAVITLLLSFGVYFLAQDVLHTSGALAVFIAVLQLRKQIILSPNFIYKFWEANTLFAILAIYLLLGVTVTIDMFVERWLAMLIGILAIVLARFTGIMGGLALLKQVKTMETISYRQQILLALSGTRGPIAIALAFTIPQTLDYWWTIQSIAFGVVLFTIIIQAPLAAWWYKHTVSKT